MEQEEKTKTHTLIDQLFEDPYFQKKLNDHIAENLEIKQGYDIYLGRYEQLKFFIGGCQIHIKEHTYG